ncbi:MAG: hypothetical protein PF689_00820 [Deltaproteobacteria bacterium]|jgi:2'-5' RNA ligase|nr:hypothetical protein [Deltaproteobacteria bacterium]
MSKEPNENIEIVEKDFPFKMEENIFLHFFIPRNTLYHLARLQKTLYDNLTDEIRDQIDWIEPHNLAFVIRFLGKVPKLSLDFLENFFMQLADSFQVKTVKSSGISVFFDNQGAPRVLSLGFKEFANEFNPAIADLDKNLLESGFFTSGNFSIPHITLGRINRELPPFITQIEKFNEQTDVTRIKLERLVLSSWSGESADTFEIIKTFPIGKKDEISRLDKNSLLPDILPACIKKDEIIQNISDKTNIDPATIEEQLDKIRRRGNLLDDRNTDKINQSEDNSNQTTDQSSENLNK